MSPIIVALHHNDIPRQNSGDISSPKTLMLTSNTSKMTTVSSSSEIDDTFSLPLVARNWRSQASTLKLVFNPISTIVSAFRSFFPTLQSLLIPSCHWTPVTPNKSKSVTTPRGSRKKRPLTGTFFGQKKCRVSLAVQETPRSEPALLLELATNTSHLVKEMASGTVRILLECEKTGNGTAKRALWDEPVWTMYCNGHKLGYAVSRECTESDLHVLSTVQSVSVGAGVMPPALMLPAPKQKHRDCAQPTAGKEIMYMRAKFDRVIGGKDSEAFYMINPDCNSGGAGKFNGGGPELSIFLLRI
ncbi:uncharacterized protein A4U43_C07F17910 [Asparagus officinalis]|uniref:Protein MIZU-KUSSEI 1 n=1 Tax=Asparagus officinalis TaxID=4686 RepID=A0A5P1ED46_ASPOF|nr:protein MIZU-KUSSEI 1-like [Asparagus officinalis]ONK63693.1 uncharacterized protein A4U43_C07F17910 [Asparagus officinalis]